MLFSFGDFIASISQNELDELDDLSKRLIACEYVQMLSDYILCIYGPYDCRMSDEVVQTEKLDSSQQKRKKKKYILEMNILSGIRMRCFKLVS